MEEIEEAVEEAVVGDIDADVGATKASVHTVPMHGGGETVMGTNYSPGAVPMHGGGEFGVMHGGAGTRQLDAGFNVNSPYSDAAPARAK